MNPIYLLLAFVSLCYANVILNTFVEGVDITQLNAISDHKINARQSPAPRRNLGQESCLKDLRTTPNPRNRQKIILFKTNLVSATCDNDIDYTSTCQVVIPAGDNSVRSYEGKCAFTEVCTQFNYQNFLGDQTSEVACIHRDNQRQQASWSTNAQSTAKQCGPGLNTIVEETKLTLSVQFYGGSNNAIRENVRHAWIQSNKRNWLVDVEYVNGMYWEGKPILGETLQACFVRSGLLNATEAVMDWVG
ncbi:hypothetical protein PTMSG1_03748 [Pyrenophora teres f. maculata]|nr:hypothetical protein PTMSG1_03748 [Pyrenophora teres f. maculata]